jgi:hypothetical protein
LDALKLGHTEIKGVNVFKVTKNKVAAARKNEVIDVKATVTTAEPGQLL